MKKAHTDVIGLLPQGKRCLLKLKNGVYVSAKRHSIGFIEEMSNTKIGLSEISRFKEL